VIVAASRRWIAPLVAMALVAAGHQGLPQVFAAEPAGVIEGTVTYRADPQRPWRYGRYYIKQTKTGELAEAVVAIRGGRLIGAGAQPQAKTVTIDQKNFQFLPETVAIRAGDSVKFTNSDQATHNVQATGDIASFNVTMPAGGSHTARLDHAGGIRQPLKIGCVFHSAMQAWVFVFDHPHFQLTTETGRFRLEGVPPGEYDLEMIHPAGALRWRKRVAVEAGAKLHVDISVSPDDKK
jgi:plastocyanin